MYKTLHLQATCNEWVGRGEYDEGYRANPNPDLVWYDDLPLQHSLQARSAINTYIYDIQPILVRICEPMEITTLYNMATSKSGQNYSSAW